MKISKILCIFLTIFVFLGCSKDITHNPNEQSQKKSSAKKNNIVLAEITENISYSFYIFQTRTDFYVEDSNGKHTANGTKDHLNYAWFTGSAGSVNINNITLGLSDNSYNSYYTFDSVMALNGSTSTISVGGSPSIPQFSANVTNPTNFAYFSNPTNGDSVSSASDLTITWQKVDNSGMTVVIEIAGINLDSSHTNFKQIFTTDNGSYTLSSSEWQNFNKGMINLTIMRGNYTIGQAPNDKYYAFVAYTQHTITCKLVD